MRPAASMDESLVEPSDLTMADVKAGYWADCWAAYLAVTWEVRKVAGSAWKKVARWVELLAQRLADWKAHETAGCLVAK